MKKICYLLFIFMLLLSCNESTKKAEKGKNRALKNKYTDKLIARENDTTYTRNLIQIDLGNDIIEEAEVYVSNYNDTILNQYKLYNKNQIDKQQSEYYNLEIWDTDKPNIYKGKITMHTVYENLQLNKKNKRTVEFAFCEQTKDSMSLKYIKSETSNTIEFEFQNYFGKRLQGKLYQLVYRDTLINGEVMLNMSQTHLLVDNYPETVNLFLGATSDIKKKKFSHEKIKLVK